jgi:hypothetical protein
MERRVLKYPLKEASIDQYVVVEMPAKAKIILVGHQDHVPTVWAEVDRRSEIPGMTNRLFRVYGTGQPVSDYDIPVGSYIDGDFVWHVYEFNA